MSMRGRGIETRSLPCRPIISPWDMNRRSSLRIIPRTICRNRVWSVSIRIGMKIAGRRADVAVAIVLYQPSLHHVDLLLRVPVDDARDEARQLDGVFLVLKELQLERLVQPFVR